MPARKPGSQEAKKPGSQEARVELANEKGGSGAKSMSSEHLSGSMTLSVWTSVVPSQDT